MTTVPITSTVVSKKKRKKKKNKKPKTDTLELFYDCNAKPEQVKNTLHLFSKDVENIWGKRQTIYEWYFPWTNEKEFKKYRI